MPFLIEKTSLTGVVLVKPKLFGDDRGFFMETYKASDFANLGLPAVFTQDNHSRSGKGVLRGLHYQLPPFAQAKLVRCIRGSIFDVAVDIRKSSPTFGKWYAHILEEDDPTMLFIPEGFAHGFYTLSETADVIYKVTAEYSPEHDRGILWNDPAIGIDWPAGKQILSPKDQLNKLLKDAEIFD
ncbi:MAG: dTDP-4-dehydrorhamnose 3,5-epimerase [Calditrichaeota bacterium]|nr:dTDP-4-dehydrorhamnose 3,5-epimerase [Calditrichota bacterium]